MTAPAGSVENAFWKPHASPRSVRALSATYPLLILAICRQNRSLLAGTVASLLVMVLFFDRMARLYDEHGRGDEGPAAG